MVLRASRSPSRFVFVLRFAGVLLVTDRTDGVDGTARPTDTGGVDPLD
ncbi:hypothetical protein [Salinigranum sp. GCM10025319]